MACSRGALLLWPHGHGDTDDTVEYSHRRRSLMPSPWRRDSLVLVPLGTINGHVHTLHAWLTFGTPRVGMHANPRPPLHASTQGVRGVLRCASSTRTLSVEKWAGSVYVCRHLRLQLLDDTKLRYYYIPGINSYITSLG